jgi:cytochrome c oxidase subunit III
MGLIGWVTYRTHKNEFGPKYYTPIECVGLFWHLVDLIWIYLFPLLYLVG